MATNTVTILGGGNTAFAAAARLTLRGFEIVLCELPEFESSLAPVRDTRTIHLEGEAEQGSAAIHSITTDVGEGCQQSQPTPKRPLPTGALS